jgi:hypothetical protein
VEGVTRNACPWPVRILSVLVVVLSVLSILLALRVQAHTPHHVTQACPVGGTLDPYDECGDAGM